MKVVKLGGSLYDLPDLGSRLYQALASLGPSPCLIVPGGGPTADVIRAFDRHHGLGPVAAHWLALRACSLNAHFVAHLLNHIPVVAEPSGAPLAVLDLHAFALADEHRPGCLPHAWSATSDSFAARVAEVYKASLVLLKSASPSGVMNAGVMDAWEAAAHAGYIDPVFPTVVARARLQVDVINLRDFPGGPAEPVRKPHHDP